MTVFTDTNVFVYAVDHREDSKRVKAGALWDVLALREDAIVSSQVASELANTLLRLWGDAEDADAVVARLDLSLRILPVMPSTIRLALEGVARFGFSFYDAQIWAAAREWGATLVLSEDFPDGLIADGVRFANPFAPGFDLEALLASA
jgi:predicted nucleic acid-binding protein